MEEKNYKKYIVFLLPVVILLVVLLFTKSSFANPELIQEISLYSEERDYLNNETNSWELKKKAKWISDHEAEIEINVKSKPFDSSAHDYIFMIDLTGENNLYLAEDFYRDYLYSEFTLPTNNVTIIGYSENPSYLFLEKETNPESIRNAFNSISDDNHLTTGDNVDYYDALLNLEDVLSNYGAQEDETIKVIFIGKPYDGLTPNNQEEEFDYIKETYTNVEFYFANTGDITTSGFLNKKVDFIGNDIELLTAANVIDEFVVTDYINTKYFEYEEVIENSYKFLAYVNCIPADDIIKSPKKVGAKAAVSSNSCYCGEPMAPARGTRSTKSMDATPSDPCGIMTLEYQMNTLEIDEETGKITWDLGNAIYSTNATLRLKVKLKDEYRDSDEIFTTNTSTQVESSLDEIEEDISTSESPELKLFYKVTYDGNMPEGCYFEPVIETHKIGSTVNTLSAPSCEGYVFKGWVGAYAGTLPDIDPNEYYESGAYQYVSYEEWYDYMLHDYEYEVEYFGESFIMPQSDVEAKALWGKLGIDKHFEGDEFGSYALYSITQKSLVNATELDDPVILHRSTITQVTLNTLDAYADYEVTAVNLSDIDYRIEVSSVNTGSTNMEFEILEEPIGVSANSSTKFTLRLKYKDGLTELPDNKNYSLQAFFRFVRDGAMLIEGTSLNERLKGYSNPDGGFYSYDDTITRIAKYQGIPDSSYLVKENLVSIIDDKFKDPVYMWYDEESTTVYWYSTSSHVYYNYDSSYLYFNLSSLTDIDGIYYFNSKYTTNMNNMFSGIGAKSINLTNNFDTSNVTNMSYMFMNTGSDGGRFTLELGPNFDTSSVINMNGMFSNSAYNSSIYNLDLGDKFDTSSVTNMGDMFRRAGNNAGTFTLILGDKFDTSNVENMQGMFEETGYRSNTFTLDLGDKFDTSNVTNMKSMFKNTGYSSTVLTLDLGDKFDTSSVTNMGDMFRNVGYNSTVFTLDLGDKFDTSNVTNMSYMFSYTGKSNPSFTLNLGTKFDTSNVTNMSYMFNYTGYNSTVFTLDLGDKFDTSSVTTMSYMFNYTGYNSTVFTLDLGDKFDTSNVTVMTYMFQRTGYSSTVFTLDLGDKFDTSNVTRMDYMFMYTGYLSPVFNLSLGTSFDTSSVTDMSWMFAGTGYSSTVFTLDLGDKFDTSNVYDMHYMFSTTGYNSTVFTLDLGDKFNPNKVRDMSWMFAHIGNSNPTFTLDLGDKFDTSSATEMGGMFSGAGYSNPDFTLDLGPKFDTSKVTEMGSMFAGSRYLKTIYVPSTFVTTAVIHSNVMFTGCSNLVGGAGTVFNSSHINAAYAHIDEGTSNPGYFTARS